jgi:hypothetical protein
MNTRNGSTVSGFRVVPASSIGGIISWNAKSPRVKGDLISSLTWGDVRNAPSSWAYARLTMCGVVHGFAAPDGQTTDNRCDGHG